MGVVSVPRGRLRIEKCPLLLGVLDFLDVRSLLPGGRPVRFSSGVDALSADALGLALVDPGGRPRCVVRASLSERFTLLPCV